MNLDVTMYLLINITLGNFFYSSTLSFFICNTGIEQCLPHRVTVKIKRKHTELYEFYLFLSGIKKVLGGISSRPPKQLLELFDYSVWA